MGRRMASSTVTVGSESDTGNEQSVMTRLRVPDDQGAGLATARPGTDRIAGGARARDALERDVEAGDRRFADLRPPDAVPALEQDLARARVDSAPYREAVRRRRALHGRQPGPPPGRRGRARRHRPG